jgi:hypothetical protein
MSITGGTATLHTQEDAMEVTSTSNQGPIQPRRQGNDERIDLTRINRDGIRDATEDIAEIRAPQEPYAIRMQRLLAQEGEKSTSTDERRARRVAELRQEYLDGKLATPERAERAAVRMLEAS